MTLRKATAEDEAFFRALFIERKRAELPGLPDVVLGPLLDTQATLWRQARAGFDHRCVLDGAQRVVGLLIVAWSGRDARLVELVIAATAQRQGHARRALDALVREVDGTLSLSVDAQNTAARALYRSVGFVDVRSDGPTVELRRQPNAAS